MIDQILDLMSDDAFAAIEHLNKHANSLEVVEAYKGLVLKLYWDRKDLPGVILAGLAGLQYALSAARSLEASEPELAVQLLGEAKGIAYNLASFTWAGWNEPGIVVGPTDELVGLEAAKLNLRLAIELSRGDLPLSRAHWVLGAQHLSAGQKDKAKLSFDRAAQYAGEAKANSEALLAVGYALITSDIFEPANEKATNEWIELTEKLEAMENGPGLIKQLETARTVIRQKWQRGSTIASSPA